MSGGLNKRRCSRSAPSPVRAASALLRNSVRVPAHGCVYVGDTDTETRRCALCSCVTLKCVRYPCFLLHGMHVTASIAIFPRVLECICVTGARSQRAEERLLRSVFLVVPKPLIYKVALKRYCSRFTFFDRRTVVLNNEKEIQNLVRQPREFQRHGAKVRNVSTLTNN